MVTCYLTYRIDPYQVDAFETYAKMWIPLVNKYGGNHHGCHTRHDLAERSQLIRLNDLLEAILGFLAQLFFPGDISKHQGWRPLLRRCLAGGHEGSLQDGLRGWRRRLGGPDRSRRECRSRPR